MSSDAFDSNVTNLTSRALQQALSRLETLGLIDGDTTTASSTISRLIVLAAERGERSEESLILFAIGRFQAESNCC